MDDVTSWARSSDVELVLPDAFPDAPERDPRGDFGRVVRRTPRHVLRPADVAGVARTLRFLAEAGAPYRLRGAAWSSGGQVLSDGGAVVDLTRLDRVVDDRPDVEEITVQGGATWLTVGQHLRKSGRRPLVLPENLHMTVGGTLAVGGLGDTSGVHGPTIAQVVRLTLVTPDGEVRRLGPADKLFRFAVGGSGLVGAIAEATLRTVRRPPTLVSRTLAWVELAAFGADAMANSDQRLYEYFQATMSWPQGAPIFHAVAGNFADAPVKGDPALYEVRPSGITESETVDRFELLRKVRTAWDLHRPSLQFVAPLPLGFELLGLLSEFILSEPVLRANVPRVGLLPFRTDAQFPLAPQPASRLALAVLLRPQVAERAVLDELLPRLRTIAERALGAGARIGLSSTGLGVADLASRQLGRSLDELRSLQAEIDPQLLCNRGVLDGLA